MDRDRILDILRSGIFEQFVGANEDEAFECKRQIYVLDTDANKREFAKDISGLANSVGGFIILGLLTQRNPATLGDEVVSVSPFSQDLVNFVQYRDVLASWTFPALLNVDMQWHPSAADGTVGLVSICVPIPDERESPHLIIKTIEDGSRVTDIMFGYAQRRTDSVRHRTVHDIHALLRRGQQYDALSHRFDRVEDLLNNALLALPREARPAPQGLTSELVQDRLRASLEEAGLEGRPSYSLLCFPVGPVEIPGLFAGRRTPLVEMIRNPPQRPQLGFNLSSGEEPYVVRGNLWRAGRRGGRQSLELWRDGTVLFLAGGDTEFLCWGRPMRGRQHSPINPYVLIETSVLFCELVRNVFSTVSDVPQQVRLGVSLSGFLGDNFQGYLLPYRPGIQGWDLSHEMRVAPEGNAFITVEVSTAMPAERASFVLVSRLYEWFGYPHEVIPFVSMHEGERIIDPGTIR